MCEMCEVLEKVDLDTFDETPAGRLIGCFSVYEAALSHADESGFVDWNDDQLEQRFEWANEFLLANAPLDKRQKQTFQAMAKQEAVPEEETSWLMTLIDLGIGIAELRVAAAWRGQRALFATS